jgi:thioesterase domain-containing protein
MASKRYNPRDYYSPILLLAARTRRDYPDDPRIRINELKLFLKGTVEEYIITGEHLDILKEPNVEKVANIITKYLKK